MKLPLEGVRVLDLSHMLPGPFCTMMLADMGAEVIKIESPKGGDGFRMREPFINKEGSAFMMLNRSKKSCVLDLRSIEGHDAFMELAKTADVVLEQFRPGVVTRLGIDYKAVSAANPGIVYLSLSGFGQDGPYVDMPGHDINYLSISGILDTIGKSDSPPAIAGVQIADLCGAQWAIISVLLGILAREKNGGKGQYVDLSMTDAVFPWLSLFLSDYVVSGSITSRGEAKSGGKYAFYNVYETSDGRYISLGAAEPKFWTNLCTMLGREEWIGRQMDSALVEEMAVLFKSRTQKEWVDMLFEADCCFTPVNNIEEALNDPQLLHRRMKTYINHPTEGEVMNFAFPVKFSDMNPVKPKSPPLYGEHNEQLIKNN